jgi:hypothetical protein
MSTYGPKYINPENIPLALCLDEEPQFLIYKLEHEGRNIRLHYCVEGRGFSIHVQDHQKWNEIPSKVEIISGGWYGNNGRWSPVERYLGTIVCESVSYIKIISETGQDFSFKVRKPFFTNQRVLTIESEKVGVVKIKCKAIIPQKHEILLFDKTKEKWMPRESMVL